MTEKEKRSLKIRLCKRLSYDKSRVMEIIKEEIDKTETTRTHGEWLRGSLWSEGCGMGEQYGYYYICSVCGHEFKGGYTKM